MSDRTAVIYCYDGTLKGLLCCIFESYEQKEQPAGIVTADRLQLSFYRVREIETDAARAKRVEAGIRRRMTDEGWEVVWLGWHSCHPERELLLYRFVRLGMRHGRRVLAMLADETVSALTKAVRNLTREAHQYKEFVRFSVCNGVLTAEIEPNNDVLFLMAPHFCDRYRNNAFLIYDRTHRQLLLHRPGRWAILPAEDYAMPDTEADEQFYRALWKRFYDAVAVEGRISERRRMNHMPKRYWNHLTELDPRLPHRMERPASSDDGGERYILLSKQEGGHCDIHALLLGEGGPHFSADPLELAAGDAPHQDQHNGVADADQEDRQHQRDPDIHPARDQKAKDTLEKQG